MPQYEARRQVPYPTDFVINVVSDPTNSHWLKSIGGSDSRVLSGDGRSKGSTFKLTSLIGTEFTFEVVESTDTCYRFRGHANVGLLEGGISVAPTDAHSCLVTWWQRDRAEHLIERLLVAVAGPLGRRASIKDAESELERLERVLKWVRDGKKGHPIHRVR